MSMFSGRENQAYDKQLEVERRYRDEAAAAEKLCAQIASSPDLVAIELIRTLSWARSEAAKIRGALKQTRIDNCERSSATYNHEKEEVLERWLLRYVSVEVQALTGLAAFGPEALAKISK